MVSSFEDKEDANNIILGKSKMALEFMQGIQLALDSLGKIGVSINLVVYDTRNDSSKAILDFPRIILLASSLFSNEETNLSFKFL